MSDIKYAIEYEHLVDELATDERRMWVFNHVKELANKYKLELSDDDFKRMFKLQNSNEDVNWLMHKMSVYKLSFVDALISYITYPS